MTMTPDDHVEYVKHGVVVPSPYPDEHHATEPEGWVWVRWADGALTMIAETSVRLEGKRCDYDCQWCDESAYWRKRRAEIRKAKAPEEEA